MKIELKNIKFSEWNSDETNCFQGDIFLNGKKVGTCHNDGRGGCTDYRGIERHETEDIKRMEEYCKTLPPIEFEGYKGTMSSIDMTLEHYLDHLLEDWLNKKEEKKKLKNFSKGLCYGKNQWSYNIITWKGHTIESLLKHPSGVEVLQKKIKEIKEEGFKILNTNLPFEV